MVTITRSLARQLRAVFRSAGFKQSSTGRKNSRVRFSAGPSGLYIEGTSGEIGLQYHLPGKFPEQRFLVPFECLAACEGKSQDQVTLEPLGEDRLVARWMQRTVPRVAEFHGGALSEFTACPDAPEEFICHPPALLAALGDAAQATDSGSLRYALGSIQLRGETGQVIATDGCQLFQHGGFDFGWEGDLLIPGSELFNCRELPREAPVDVARIDKHLVLWIDRWTIYLKINQEGRFPKTADLIRPTTAATSNLHLAPVDQAFLRDALPHLPALHSLNQSVTVDLNGHVIVRSRSEGQAQPTELVLNNSRLEGVALKATMNRKYLERAMKLGFQQVQFFGPEAPAQCDDGQRQYVWAVLHPTTVLAGGAEAIRIESPQESPIAEGPSNRRTPRRKLVASVEATSPLAAVCIDPGSIGADGQVSGPIETAVNLQRSLRSLLGHTKALIAALRRERKQTRLMRRLSSSPRHREAATG